MLQLYHHQRSSVITFRLKKMAVMLPTHTPELFAAAVQQAVSLLKSGELVAVPTETVYGLAANAFDAQAVSRIFEIKGRPANNPIIVPRMLGLASPLRSFGNAVRRLESRSGRNPSRPFALVLMRTTSQRVASSPRDVSGRRLVQRPSLTLETT